MTYHKFIAEKVQITKDAFDNRMREYRACQRILDELGLLPMLDRAFDFHVFEDQPLSRKEHLATGRFHIMIRLPLSDKPHVHHLLREMVLLVVLGVHEVVGLGLLVEVLDAPLLDVGYLEGLAAAE